MNLFELFATITLDDSGYKKGLDDAVNHTSKLSDSIKSGLATAAKVGTATITAAATGIAALTKASVQNYAEYEQLVGGLKLSLGDSYDFMAEKAKSAYETMGLSTNEYMNQVSIYATGLVNALATTTKQAEGAITEATIDSLNKQLDAMQDTQDKNVEAVESANEKEIELLEESYEKQLEDFEKLTEERIKLIDKQYAENMKLVDEEEYRRLQAVQAQIDAINAEQAADDKAAKQREENEKKAALQEKISTAETAEEKKKAQEEYNEYLEELRQEQIEADRKARIDSLKSEKDAIKEEADEKRKALKEQRDNDVKVIQESAATELQERKKGQAAQLKALKESQAAELKALKDSNKQKLDAMRDYIAQQKKLVTDGTVQVTQVTEEARRQAAVLADDILTAQADIVAATGQSQDAVQNAFSGLMRSEYTLLDNLRLGITPTKEGFQEIIDKVNEWNAANGNATNYMIDNLADAQNALIDYVEMQGYAGYAAAEASSTISGSLASAKAAWSNLVTGIADENADIGVLINNFVDSVATVGGNLIPRVKQILSTIGEVVQNGLKAVYAKIRERLDSWGVLEEFDTVVENAKNTLNKIVTVFTNLKNKAKEVFPKVKDAVTDSFSRIKKAIQPAIDFFGNLIGKIKEYFESGQAAEDTTNALSSVIQFLGDGISALSDFMATAVEKITDFVKWMSEGSTGADVLLSVITGLTAALIAHEVATKAVTAATLIMEGAQKAITVAQTALNAVMNANPFVLIATLIAGVTAAFVTLWNTNEDFRNAVIGIWEGIKTTFSTAWESIKTIFGKAGDFFSSVWNNIKDAFSGVGVWFTKIFSKAKNGVVSAWENIKEKFAEIWEGIKSVFSGAFSVGEDIVNKIWNGIKSAWNTLTEGVKNLWNEFTSWLEGEEKSTTHVSSSGRTHGGGGIDGSHFGGLEYVPFDGYIAELHKGEMVLTADEAKGYSKKEPTVINQYNTFGGTSTLWELNKANQQLVAAIE